MSHCSKTFSVDFLDFWTIEEFGEYTNKFTKNKQFNIMKKRKADTKIDLSQKMKLRYIFLNIELVYGRFLKTCRRY